MVLSTEPQPVFVAKYDRKDVILYALSIGFSTGDWSYVHENDEDFRVAPTYPLALLFLAYIEGQDQRESSLPSFPPPIFRTMGLIPSSLLKDPTHTLHDYPALHVFQSISWQKTCNPPVPTTQQSQQVYLRPRFLAVYPKQIGTFVSTETKLYDRPSAARSSLICTMVSTTLILGLDASLVRAYGISTQSKTAEEDESTVSSKTNSKTALKDQDSLVLVDVDEKIDQNAALLYRIASGDSNRIHVDVSPFGKPILHGLCTLGIVSRVLLQNSEDMELRQLEGRFVKPVFVGDIIRVQVWATPGDSSRSKNVSFQVSVADAKVSHGRATLEKIHRPNL